MPSSFRCDFGERPDETYTISIGDNFFPSLSSSGGTKRHRLYTQVVHTCNTTQLPPFYKLGLLDAWVNIHKRHASNRPRNQTAEHGLIMTSVQYVNYSFIIIILFMNIQPSNVFVTILNTCR